MKMTVDGLAMRRVTDEEYDAFATAVETAFGGQARPEEVALWRRITELDRSVAVFDDGRIVGTGTTDSFELTVPGGSSVPMAGVTAIGVAPTHRRRGLLTAMMRRLLDDAHERQEPLAGLWASESSIYARFGFGQATSGLRLRVDTRRAAFTAPAPRTGLRLLDPAEATAVLPAVYERARPAVGGMLSRSPARWALTSHDPEHRRGGASRRFAVVSGDLGYALYRMKEDEDAAGAAFTLLVEELVAVDDATLAALWRYLLDMDLVTTVTADRRPVDDPLPLLLADPRQAVTRVIDALWLRVLDVPTALAARDYPRTGSLAFSVHDAFCPWVSGTYLLEVRHGHARCAPTGQTPHLALDATALGAVYLGGVRPSQLARVGRVSELEPGALAHADDLFVTARAPWCPFVF